MSPGQFVRLTAMQMAAKVAWRAFERRTRRADRVNEAALLKILTANAQTEFGRRHEFEQILQSTDPSAAFHDCVPLSTYADYRDAVDRIAAGETDVLTHEPVHLLALSAGTTAAPKRIPRTRSAQLNHLMLVVLAEQAVVNRDIAGATKRRRGINLMSLYVPPQGSAASAIPTMSGPNAGMARIRRLIPLLWASPEPAFMIGDQNAALYVHALFGLAERDAKFVETPFAHKLLGWFNLIESEWPHLVRDLRGGTLAARLALSPSERAAIEPYLRPNPHRAAEVAAACAGGGPRLARRIWPNLRYVRTVTSGTFALSVPGLRRFVGDDVVIHSGCHSSSEGVIGINPRGDGATRYVLACGAAHFEFLPIDSADDERPSATHRHVKQPAELETGQCYEIIMTSSAGLYRYRLGDVVKIVGRYGAAPLFEYRYRKGTILNLAGEKTTEFHTSQALTRAVMRCGGSARLLHDYTTLGRMEGKAGRYTFYVELTSGFVAAPAWAERLVPVLDEELARANPFYYRNGRETERLLAPRIKVVRPGAFSMLANARLAVEPALNPMQLKQSRLLQSPDDIQLLERCLAR